MASESYFTLQAARNKLSETLALVLIDLDDMEAGINQLPKHEQKEHWETLNRLDALVQAIQAYDQCAQNYVRYHPDFNNTRYLSERLQLARKYVTRLGGDWDMVHYGSLSDFP
jgi:uncharacterized membrane protein